MHHILGSVSRIIVATVIVVGCLSGYAAAAPTSVEPSIVDAPYKYLYTPTHAQERGYWCGPASVQIIDDYFGAHAAQSDIAAHMGTGSEGTDFSRVDDELRYRTGKNYSYFGSLTEPGFNTRVVDSIMNHGMPVAADANIVASVWPNYVYDHSGHIFPIEAFDWRWMNVRLNDPYSESFWSHGGDTLGHKTYSQAVVWHGVSSHPRKAVVSAP